MKFLKMSLLAFITFCVFSSSMYLGAQDDTTPPSLISLSMSPAVIDITGGDQIVDVTWQLTDDLVGVAAGSEGFSPTQMRLMSPSGQQFKDAVVGSWNLTSGDMNNGTFMSPLTFPQYCESGIWQIAYVLLVDALGNSNRLYTSDLATMGINTDLNVEGTSDTSPPELVDLTFDPISIDTSEADKIVTFTWHLSDDLVGVATGTEGFSPTQLRFMSPSGQQIRDNVVSVWDLSDGDMNDGTFVIQTTFPQFSEIGIWQIAYVLLVDALGNSHRLYTSDLATMGINTQLTVGTPNLPPIAEAGPDQTTDEGSIVTLDATGSHDPDGGIDLCEWDFGDGSPTETGVIVSYLFSDNGVYTVTLTVTDDDGAFASDTTVITINNVNPVVSIDSMILPVAGFILPGDIIQFAGSFSDSGHIDTHTSLWDFGDGSTSTGNLTEENIYPDSTGNVTVEHLFENPGSYSVTLTVTDDDGGSNSVTQSLQVKSATGAISDLITYVKNLGLPKGIENSLVSKLTNAIKSLLSGNIKLAANKLKAFINEVQAQKGKKITSLHASYMIQHAQAIIDHL